MKGTPRRRQPSPILYACRQLISSTGDSRKSGVGLCSFASRLITPMRPVEPLLDDDAEASEFSEWWNRCKCDIVWACHRIIYRPAV